MSSAVINDDHRVSILLAAAETLSITKSEDLICISESVDAVERKQYDTVATILYQYRKAEYYAPKSFQ